jgi:hypothetical protein
MRAWAGLALVTMLAIGLVLVLTVDTDGDPLTVDYPNVVLTAVSGCEMASDFEDPEGYRGEQHVVARTSGVLAVHRMCRRWMPAVRRWHTSFLADPPV